MDNKNYLIWCMDSLRWDMFEQSDAPTMKSLINFRMTYSHAVWTPPAILDMFTNPRWHNIPGFFINELQQMSWIPKELKLKGYYNQLETANQLLLKYSHAFRGSFDKYSVFWTDFKYGADVIVDRVIDTYKKIEQPKFIFCLFMETHQPFPYSKDVSKEELNEKYRPVIGQIKSVESLDREMKRLLPIIDGTNTELLVLSDHGDLDLKIDGHQGHPVNVHHQKLFEIPWGRTII